MHLFSPATADEALALLIAAPLTVDSPTQRRHRTELHLRDTLDSGRRRASWVWAARDDDGTLLGVVAALGPPSGSDVPFVLDLLGLPDDPEVAMALVAHASDAGRALGLAEACVFAPSGATLDDAGLAAVADPLRAAGWSLFVERRHYEFAPTAALLTDPGPGLRFEQLTDPGDPRLREVHREVMRETLDAHDAATVARVGFDAACAESLAYLLESDPVECLHLAIDDGGDVVGMASILATATGRGFVLFVGVAHAHRGHGYGRRILAWQTARLLEAGSTTLIADTDNANLPMARAFADVGWPQTETRIDLV